MVDSAKPSQEASAMTNIESRSALSANVALIPGDFAVVQRRFRYVAVNVEKVTAAQFKASGEWSSRVRVYRRSDAIFSGTEESAKQLVVRLASSDALCEEEKRKSEKRRQERNGEIIAKATGSQSSAECKAHSAARLSGFPSPSQEGK